MLQLELPHINVLSKVDLLETAGDLRSSLPFPDPLAPNVTWKGTAFNLEYYTEVQDLSRLIPLLEADPRTKKFSALNELICEIVEDFALVSFETLCVEVRRTLTSRPSYDGWRV